MPESNAEFYAWAHVYVLFLMGGSRRSSDVVACAQGDVEVEFGLVQGDYLGIVLHKL